MGDQEDIIEENRSNSHEHIRLILEFTILERLGFVGPPWSKFLTLETLDLTQFGHCKIGLASKIIHDFCIKNLLVIAIGGDSLGQVLSNILPTDVSQLMHRPIDDISKISENEQVLGCLGFFKENQFILVSLAQFIQGRGIERPRAGPLDVSTFCQADKGFFFCDEAGGINFDSHCFILQFAETR